MAITLSQLVTIIRSSYNSADGDPFFNDAWMQNQVFAAEMELAIAGYVIENSLQTTSVSGTRVLAYPSNVLGIKELRYNYLKLKKVPLDQDPKSSSTDVTGTPESYGIWDKEIYLFPTPAVSLDVIEIKVFSMPQMLITSTAALNVPDEYQIQIKDYVLAQMCFKDQNINLGNTYLQKWEQSVQRAREAKRRAERSDRYNRVRDVYFGTDTPRWDEKGIYYEW
jgi:hypothetical protein